VNGIRQDAADALRQLLRRPGFALVIVLTLGTAMGVNTSLFSVFNTEFLRPWRVKDPDRVVVVHPAVSLSEWRSWSEHATSLSGLLARGGSGSARSEGRRLRFEFVSASYFAVLGIPLERGRAFAPADDRMNGPGTAAILSHRLWQTHLASDPAALGRSLVLDGVPFTIVGVAAQGFDGPEKGRLDLWLPLSAYPRLQATDRRPPRAGSEADRMVSVVGRLAGDVAAEQAQAELRISSHRFRAQHALTAEPILVRGTSAFAQPHSFAEDMLAAGMLVAITFVTMIACANVANLLLARGYARRGEIALRLSLGASRARVVRQLLAEALLLAILASLLGLAIAATLPNYVMTLVPEVQPWMARDFRADYRVFAYALALSTVACLAFGLAPALQTTRISVSHALKDAHVFSAPALKSALLGYQVIVSVMLLAVAGLLVRGVHHAHTRSLGYSMDDLLVVRVELPRTYSRAERSRRATQLVHEVQSLAGPSNVAAVSAIPAPGTQWREETVFDLVSGGVRRVGSAWRLQVAPSYFDLLRIPIVGGRGFAQGDAPDAVALVNEAFVRRFCPGESPLGKTLLGGGATRQVIGVTRDAYLGSLDAVEPAIFQLVTADGVQALLVRDAGHGLTGALTPLIATIDPAIHTEVIPGRSWLRRSMARSLFGARILGGVGVLALALATLGLFSVSTYAVQQRTHEIGIRIALGARPAHILETVFRPASRAMMRGFVVGGLGGVAAAHLMRQWGWLHGLSPLDPVTYIAVAVVLVTAGGIASYLPARRAMKVQPTVALRYE
jgi:predicted permease